MPARSRPHQSGRVQAHGLNKLNKLFKLCDCSWGDGAYVDTVTGELVMSACIPLYSADGTVLGVFIGDCLLNQITSSLEILKPGKTGEAYVTENVGGTDYLVGASVGQISDSSSGTMERVAPPASTSSQIRESYSYLIDNGYSLTSTALSSQKASYLGDPLLQTAPAVSMTNYTDLTGKIEWRLVVTVPVEDYYDFVFNSMWITAVMYAVVFLILIFVIVTACRTRVQTTESGPRTVKQSLAALMNGIHVCMLVGLLLWVWWYALLQLVAFNSPDLLVVGW